MGSKTVQNISTFLRFSFATCELSRKLLFLWYVETSSLCSRMVQWINKGKFVDSAEEIAFTIIATNEDNATVRIQNNFGGLDSDDDGILDRIEYMHDTDPFKQDSDNDFWDDSTDFSPTDPLMPNVMLIIFFLICIFAFFIGRETKSYYY